MASFILVNDVLGFLTDKDILILAAASAKVRGRVAVARRKGVPILLVPGVGIHGLWNHFEYWEVALCLEQCAELTIASKMSLRTVRLVRGFLTALHIARKPFTWSGKHCTLPSIAPQMVLVADFRFPRCNFSADGEVEVDSSQVNLPRFEESVFLSVSKERYAGEYFINLFLERAGRNQFNYAVSAVSLKLGIQLMTDFTHPLHAPPEERGTAMKCEWLSGHRRRHPIGDLGPNTTLRQDIEGGRSITFILSVYFLNLDLLP